MRKQQTSTTAMGIAAMRAMESARPASERILYDPYARQMIPRWLYYLSLFFTRIGYAELRGPGVQGYLSARDRYIDDFLLKGLAEGTQQVVILGAGFDARAFRFKAELGQSRVFEVDHPATQKDKLSRLEKIFGHIPEGVTFVPVDFNQQSLETRLLECGYNPALKTIFIWQGVVMYLDPDAVDSTLDFIQRQSGPGSSVIFDYIYQSALDGARGHGEVSGMKRYRGLTGEGLTFGIPDGTIEAFMQARGYTGVRNIDSQALREVYFKNQDRKVISGYGIVSAEVAR